MTPSSVFQSLIAINAKNIDAANIFYQSYQDILKDFRECGKSDDEAYSRYTKLAKKELTKMHLLARNQRILIDSLREAYEDEDYERLTAYEEEGCYE